MQPLGLQQSCQQCVLILAITVLVVQNIDSCLRLITRQSQG